MDGAADAFPIHRCATPERTIAVPSNSQLDAFTSPGVSWMLVILGLCIGLLFDPTARKVWKVFLVVVASWIMLPLTDRFMRFESLQFPWKFDYYLYRIDQGLGLSAFAVAGAASTEWQQTLLLGVYSSLVLMMIAWYAVNLQSRDGRPGKLLIAYLIMLFSGPLLYTIVPGRGPRHAFAAAFPAGNPEVPLTLVKLDGWPNAMPSLHVATALLLVLFAGQNKILRALAWAYLALTVAATLAFEHYVIDLIVAVPFACFIAAAAERRVRQACYLLMTVLGWLIAIRFTTPALIANPYLLRILAAATLVLSFAGTTRIRKAGFPAAPAIDDPAQTASAGTPSSDTQPSDRLAPVFSAESAGVGPDLPQPRRNLVK